MEQYQQLTRYERYMINMLLDQNFSKSAIAKVLERDRSTIYREIARNSGKRGYRQKQAQDKAMERRQNAHKHFKIDYSTYELVVSYINEDWSPEQVSNYLRLEYDRQISTERIYQLIWDDKQNGGKLHTHLRQNRKRRRKRYGTGYDSRGHIKNRISIDERPALVDTRERTGDWEIDTVIGKGHKGALVTIVERQTRSTLIGKVESRDSSLVGEQTVKLLRPFSDYVYSITGDNGKEFAQHEKIMADLETTFYFAHPYSSWERGLNENTNGLIRQYIPKGSDLTNYTDADLVNIMNKLNNRPRKCLNYRTPNEVFKEKTGFSLFPPGETVKEGKKRHKKDAVAVCKLNLSLNIICSK